jgi:hypothetical protein
MARIKPDDPYYYVTNSGAEKRIYVSLKEHLNDEWLVCYSWRWLKHPQNQKTKKQQGEGDFILFHPDCGIIVIEVKGGSIEYRDNGKYYSNGKLIQNPEKQASDTKFDIIQRLTDNNLNNKCYVSHCVWFPDIRWNIDYPPNLNSKTLFDERTLSNPEPILKALSPSYIKRVESNHIQLIENILHKPFKIVKSLKFKISDTIEEQVRLNQEQIKAFEYLVEQKCIGVRGRAGTGKTLLAIQRAKEMAMFGKENVLFLCFNSGLAEFIRNEINTYENIHISTMHSYALKYLEKYHPGRCLDKDLKSTEQFNYILNEWSEVIEDNKDNFSACIIDEAQDIAPEIFSAIKDAFYPSKKFYW